MVRCTVSTLAEETRKNGITKTALIVVGDFLGENYERSKLYDPPLPPSSGRGRRPGSEPGISGLHAKGEALAHRLAEALPGSVSRCGGDVT